MRRPLAHRSWPAAAALVVAAILSAIAARPRAVAQERDILPDLRIASAEGGAFQPSVAIDAKGSVHVAFVAGGEIRINSLPAGAMKWEEPHMIAAEPKVMFGMRRGPRLAACEDALVASWIAPTPKDARSETVRDWDLVASRSTDGGATWSKPVRVNRTVGACGEGLHSMAAGPGKTVYAAWNQPMRPGKPGMSVRFARSEDGGSNWGHETQVYDPPSGTICECCHPTVAVAPDGTVAVMFRNLLDGARDMYVVRSIDAGKSFGPAKKLGWGTWPLKACPMDGGGAAFGEGNKLIAVWRRENRIFLTRGNDREEDLGAGEQAWIGGIPGMGPWAIWTRPGGSLFVLSLQFPSKIDLGDPAERQSYPSIAGAVGDRVFAAWESRANDGSPPTIRGVYFVLPSPPK